MLILAGLLLLGVLAWVLSQRSRRSGPTTGSDSVNSKDRLALSASRHGKGRLGPPATGAVAEMIAVSKAYGSGDRRRLALDGLDLEIRAGEIFGLLGENGAGKTTALRCMLGLARPTSGSCRLLGADTARSLYKVIGRVAALIETPGFVPGLSGRRNLALLGRLDRIGAKGIDDALDAVGLGDRADEPVAGYSLGMRQRLGIAAALLRDPEVVVLDEPSNGLDPAGIADVRALFVTLAGQGRTVIVSSHLLGEMEKTCDHLAVIRAGHCVAAGPIDEVIARAGPGAIVVGINDPVAAQRALAAAGIEATVVDGDGTALRVDYAPKGAAHITEVLAANGLYLSELRHEKPTLEAAFLGLTSSREQWGG